MSGGARGAQEEDRGSTGAQGEDRRSTGGGQEEHRRRTRGGQEKDGRSTGGAQEGHSCYSHKTEGSRAKVSSLSKVFPSHQHVTHCCRALKGLRLEKSKQGQSSARLHLPSFHLGWKLLETARDDVMIHNVMIWSPAVPSDLLPAWPPEPSEKRFFLTPFCRLLKTLISINSFSFNYLSLNFFFCSSTTHRKASGFLAIPPRSKTSNTIFMCTL